MRANRLSDSATAVERSAVVSGAPLGLLISVLMVSVLARPKRSAAPRRDAAADGSLSSLARPRGESVSEPPSASDPVMSG